MDLTGFSQDMVEIALYDSKYDTDKAIYEVLERETDEYEWRESGKKKKLQKQSEAPPPDNHADSIPDRRDNKERNDRNNRDRNKEEKENGEMGYRETSYNYRQRTRQYDNRTPRLSRGLGRPDGAGDRPERDDDGEKDENKDRGFDRGRGRGRGFGLRRGRVGRPFRANRSGFETRTSSNFENGSQIDIWTNETVIGVKEPNTSKAPPNLPPAVPLMAQQYIMGQGTLPFYVTNAAHVVTPANAKYQQKNNGSHVQYGTNKMYDDLTAQTGGDFKSPYGASQTKPKANISSSRTGGSGSSDIQIPGYGGKTHAQIGSGQNLSLQNSIASQTASSVSLNDLTWNNLTSLPGTSLAGNSLTSLTGNTLSAGTPVNSLTGSALHSTSLSGNDLTRNSLTSLPGTSLAGNSLIGTNVTGSGLTSLTGNTLSAGTQSVAGPSSVIPASTVSQNAMLQQRQKPQRSKLPPSSKIPASAVEMPGNIMTTLDVQFGGNLEFDDSPAFSFGGNESVTSAFTSANSRSTPTINDHVGATVCQVQVPNIGKTSEAFVSTGVEQTSPRSSFLYQQSPYTTSNKHNPADSSNTIMDLTGFSQDNLEIALYDSNNDMYKAIHELLEDGTDESELRKSGNKKKKKKKKKK